MGCNKGVLSQWDITRESQILMWYVLSVLKKLNISLVTLHYIYFAEAICTIEQHDE